MGRSGHVQRTATVCGAGAITLALALIYFRLLYHRGEFET